MLASWLVLAGGVDGMGDGAILCVGFAWEGLFQHTEQVGYVLVYLQCIECRRGLRMSALSYLAAVRGFATSG